MCARGTWHAQQRKHKAGLFLLPGPVVLLRPWPLATPSSIVLPSFADRRPWPLATPSPTETRPDVPPPIIVRAVTIRMSESEHEPVTVAGQPSTPNDLSTIQRLNELHRSVRQCGFVSLADALNAGLLCVDRGAASKRAVAFYSSLLHRST